MASLEQFSRRIAQIGNGVAVETDKTVRMAALAADQSVVMATPVDKGRARSNWIVALGSPSRDVIEPYAPGEEGSTGGANATAALAQGSTTIAGYSGLLHGSIAISNNLPYIGRLNQGSSAQAPAGFVEKAVQSAVRAVRRVRLVR